MPKGFVLFDCRNSDGKLSSDTGDVLGKGDIPSGDKIGEQKGQDEFEEDLGSDKNRVDIALYDSFLKQELEDDNGC